LFHHLPGFAVMREPQKAVALLALAYGYFFGVGAERFIQSARTQKGAAAMGVAMVVLPIAYNPSLFWGLHGRLHTDSYSPSWAAADRLMGEGPGKVLFLPWHQYMGFAFTDARTVATPAKV